MVTVLPEINLLFIFILSYIFIAEFSWMDVNLIFNIFFIFPMLLMHNKNLIKLYYVATNINKFNIWYLKIQYLKIFTQILINLWSRLKDWNFSILLSFLFQKNLKFHRFDLFTIWWQFYWSRIHVDCKMRRKKLFQKIKFEKYVKNFFNMKGDFFFKFLFLNWRSIKVIASFKNFHQFAFFNKFQNLLSLKI